MSKATWFRAMGDGRFEPAPSGNRPTARSATAPENSPSPPPLWPSRREPSLRTDRRPIYGASRDRTTTRRSSSSPVGPEPSTFDGVIVHRPRDLTDLNPVRKLNIATTNVLRLLCDLGAVDPARRQPRSATSSPPPGVASRPAATPSAATRRRAPRRPRLPGRARGLVIDGKPVDSVLEPAMRRLFEKYRLPPFEFHAPDSAIRRRLLDRRYAVVLECDGWEFHAKTRPSSTPTPP